MKNKTNYEFSFRCKFLSQGAESVDGLILALEGSASLLKEFKPLIESGKIVSDFTGADDDYISFYTNDKEIADRYNMTKFPHDVIGIGN